MVGQVEKFKQKKKYKTKKDREEKKEEKEEEEEEEGGGGMACVHHANGPHACKDGSKCACRSIAFHRSPDDCAKAPLTSHHRHTYHSRVLRVQRHSEEQKEQADA